MIHRKTELTVRVRHQSPALAQVMQQAQARNAKVLASCVYSQRDGMVLLLVTEHADALQQALADAGYLVQSHSVVLIGPQQNPAIAPMVRLQLARVGVGILRSYASWDEDGLGYFVFHTTDNTRALRLLSADHILEELAETRVWHEEPKRAAA